MEDSHSFKMQKGFSSLSNRRQRQIERLKRLSQRGSKAGTPCASPQKSPRSSGHSPRRSNRSQSERYTHKPGQAHLGGDLKTCSYRYPGSKKNNNRQRSKSANYDKAPASRDYHDKRSHSQRGYHAQRKSYDAKPKYDSKPKSAYGYDALEKSNFSKKKEFKPQMNKWVNYHVDLNKSDEETRSEPKTPEVKIEITPIRESDPDIQAIVADLPELARRSREVSSWAEVEDLEGEMFGDLNSFHSIALAATFGKKLQTKAQDRKESAYSLSE
jgi:hypothetical protein